MSHTISATFKTGNAAYEALRRLDIAGFTEQQVSVVTTDNSEGQSFNIEQDNKAAEGGTIGGTAGGLAGAILGALAATGAVAIPGVNLLVAGSLVAAAAGAGIGAAAGGLIGALVGMGIPEYEAKRYENDVKNGATLVVVEANDGDQADIAKSIFEHEDAHNIAA